jgi:hypothetical protein
VAAKEKVPPANLVLVLKGLVHKGAFEEKWLERLGSAPFIEALEDGSCHEVWCLLLSKPLL